MKKVLFVLAFCAFCTLGANAQVNFGAKTGVNVSWLSTDVKGAKVNPVSGYYIGGFSDISLSSKWTLRPELLYSGQGGKFTEGKPSNSKVKNQKQTVTRISNHYFVLPVLVQYEFVKDIKIGVGPQIGYSFSSKSKKSNEKKSTDLKNHANIGAVVDLYFATTDHFGFNARYYHGFSDVDKTKNKSTNKSFSLGINYTF